MWCIVRWWHVMSRMLLDELVSMSYVLRILFTDGL